MEAKLNKFLSDLAVEQQKLQSLHWYVKGADFEVAHLKLEELYDECGEFVDEIAEAMLMTSMKPCSTMKEFLEHTSLKESEGDFITSKQAFEKVSADFKTLLESATMLKDQAESSSKIVIALKCDTIIESLSKHIWMLDQR